MAAGPWVRAPASPSPELSPVETAWMVAPALTTSTKTQDTIGRPQTARRGQEQRGRAAPLSPGGEKYIDFMLSESFINFLSEALTISKETLQLREYVAQEAGPVASPGSALDGCVHCPSVPQPVLGAAQPGPRAQVWFGWGGGAPQRTAGLRSRPRRELWRHEARGRRGCCPDGWAAAHSSACRCRPLEWRAQRGRQSP